MESAPTTGQPRQRPAIRQVTTDANAEADRIDQPSYFVGPDQIQRRPMNRPSTKKMGSE